MSYSLIIRTLTGGGKYRLLLDSIARQTVKPDNVFIVLAHGYEPPKEQLGFEKFIYTNKGMWEQRIFGMEYCCNAANHSEYLLVCDDDVEFEPDFVEKLINICEETKADCLIPIQDNFAGPKSQLMGSLTGQRTENKTSKYKIRIKKSGSFSVNNHLKNNVNPTQSGPFQCFMMRTDIVSKLKLRDEMWLDGTRYAWPDDQVFFYKAHTLGLNVLSCKDPKFEHLNGRSGVSTAERRNDYNYTNSRNGYIFWRKFLYQPQKNPIKKIQLIFARKNLQSWSMLRLLLIGIKHKDFSSLKSYIKGLKDARSMFK